MSWQGNSINTPPNNVQAPSADSAINIGENRAFNTRRDTDTVRNVSTTLLDIDTTIFDYLDKNINPHVVGTNESRIKVPIIYGSPERWKSVRVDGVFRDYNGKIQLPVLMFKRNNVVKNDSLATLNRHLTYPVMTKYTQKNQYDKFSTLTSNSVPVNNVFAISLPDHVKITYGFMIWTEFVEQMNAVVEKINFASEDYWGDDKRYKFRVYADDYTNNIEIESGKNRMVRTEFNITVMAYLLPESFEDKNLTTQKLLTPRQIIVTEGSSDNLNREDGYKVNSDAAVKASLVDNYVQLDSEIGSMPAPTISTGQTTPGIVTIEKIRSAYTNLINASISTANNNGGVIWHTPPTSATSYGQEGWMAYDNYFHYIYVNGTWKRQPIANFNTF